MNSLGELLGAIFGPVAALAEWVSSWVPRYVIVRWNERGVRFRRGEEPEEVEPGVCWYVPALTEVERRQVVRDSFVVPPQTVETRDGVACTVGVVVAYSIVDIVAFAAENVDPVGNMAEAAEGVVRDLVMEHTWDELQRPTEDGKLLHGILVRRVQTALGERYGIEVETVRPTDQVRMGRGVFRIFGASHSSEG